MNTIIQTFLIGVIAVVVVLASWPKSTTQLGSIDTFEGYNSTSTGSSWDAPAQATARIKLLKTGPGVLGSVLITNETVGQFNLYDATSTNHGDHATTTLANIRASLAEGTYTFDSVFSRGLIVEFQSSNVASSTITWK